MKSCSWWMLPATLALLSIAPVAVADDHISDETKKCLTCHQEEKGML